MNLTELIKTLTWHNLITKLKEILNSIPKTGEEIVTKIDEELGNEDWKTGGANKEDSLGNPDADGKVLSSTTSGVRTWVELTEDQTASEVPVTPSGNLTSDNVQDAIESLQLEIDDLNGATLDINYQTGTTYTPVLSDALIPISLNNASEVVVTIPNNTSVAYPTNTLLNFWQTGDGVVRTVRQLGVVSPDLRITDKYGMISIIKINTNTWIPYGLGNSSEIYTNNLYTALNAINPDNETNALTGITNPDGLTTLTVETSDTDLGDYALRITHNGPDNTLVSVLTQFTALIGQSYTVKVRAKELVGTNWSIMLDDSFGWTADTNINTLSSSYAEYTLTGVASSTTPFIRFYGTSSSDTNNVFLISSIVITQD